MTVYKQIDLVIALQLCISLPELSLRLIGQDGILSYVISLLWGELSARGLKLLFSLPPILLSHFYLSYSLGYSGITLLNLADLVKLRYILHGT